MHDLVPHIDRRAVFLERTLDDFDGTHHAGAKAARLCKINFHGTPVTQVAPNSFPHVPQLGSLQYPHHARFGIRPSPKRMEAQGFVSKNGGLEKLRLEHGRPKWGEVSVRLISVL
jgi:hypothetical protein